MVPFPRRIARIGSLLAPTLLSGCQMGVDVAVTKVGDAVHFVVTRSGMHLGQSSPPCIDGLSIHRSGPSQRHSEKWEISDTGARNCPSRFTYGRVPAGWSGWPDGTAPALEPGVTYTVEVSGPGLIGGTDFTMRAGDGRLTGGANER